MTRQGQILSFGHDRASSDWMGIKETEEIEWRELCERASKELDPHRLSQLVDQLIEKLDARRQALHGHKQGSAGNSGEDDK